MILRAIVCLNGELEKEESRDRKIEIDLSNVAKNQLYNESQGELKLGDDSFYL